MTGVYNSQNCQIQGEIRLHLFLHSQAAGSDRMPDRAQPLPARALSRALPDRATM